MNQPGRQDTGRQDIVAPEPSLEESETIPKQHGRGIRLFVWTGVLTVIFLAIIIAIIVAR